VTNRAKNLPADERRALTVKTVLELAGSQVPSNITTAAIANRMRVTEGALFRHFASKDAIWQSVMEWVADRLLTRLDRAVEGIDSPLAALQAIFTTHVEFVAEHPGVPRMMFGELQQPKSTLAKRVVRSLLKQYAQRLHRLIETGKSRGELPLALDTEAAAMLFIGTIQGLVMQALLADDVQRIRCDAPRVFAVYRRGLVNES